ncbi:helix-turn-helix transcriptional regulator [Mucilaginibacter sp. 21P]|uniref:helix-turn-helix domain-containing protein n=1 Tax=Mucilaginibacter sp. 21P TaxID=2778902 RepID=UPI001C58E5ED|nr:AraC family transcriptional regulator [Mucilaginibacter sp. 21P]QXV64265.1 helix-turn-helix transcriptional regulator [Mucilaginibacter sp. 21P]
MLKRFLKYNFSLLNVDHTELSNKWNYKNVISPYYRIYYIDAGEGEISDLGNRLQLEPGYLYLIPSFTLCNLSCPNYLSQYFVQFFEESSDGISLFSNNRMVMKVQANDIDVINIKRLLEINPGRGINRSDNPRIYEKIIFYKEYQQLNHQQNISTFLETQGIILQFVSRFLKQGLLKNKHDTGIPAKILDAMSYIQLNLDQELSAIELAKRANQNTDYFSRLFQKHTGERPISYINSKRIERAQYLMLTTQMTLAQVAAHTGFKNVFYFSKIFKKVTGITPKSYVNQSNLFEL